VTAAEPGRVDDSGKRKVLRPLITVATPDEVLIEPDAVLTSPGRPRQSGRVLSVCPAAGGVTEVTLELKGGMGRGLAATPGSVPAVGESVTYTTLKDEFRRPPEFPAQEQTPWTHGGPPAQDPPGLDADEVAREEWS
jgi:hypothetical protein